MLDLAKIDVAVPPRPAVEEIDIGTLLAACDARPSAPLVFVYDGHAVRPGYHVTEVKAGQFSALDCGGNPEAWPEIFIQLWDVDDGDRTHMTAGKFAAIIRKVADHVALDIDARLTFEVSDGVVPIQLHRASTPDADEDALRVLLSPRPSSCKPRDRWLEEQTRASAGCTRSTSPQPCCR